MKTEKKPATLGTQDKDKIRKPQHKNTWWIPLHAKKHN